VALTPHDTRSPGAPRGDDMTASDDMTAWDDLNGGRFYTSAAWLRAFTDLGGSPAVTRVGTGAAVVGHRAAVEHSNPRYTHRWLYGDALREDVEHHTLLGGNAGYESHFPARPGATAAEQRALVTELVGHLGEKALLVAHATTAEASHLLAERVLPGGATPVLGMAVAELQLGAATTFEDYVATLTRANRNGVRRDLRRFDASGLHTRMQPLVDVVDEVAPLLGQVQGHHGENPDPDAAAGYLRLCCHAELGRLATAFVVRDPDDVPVAFALGFPWHDTIFMRVAGLDYDRATRTGAYFESYFYAPIRHALATGRTRVDFGGESLESKSRRGARLVPRWALSAGVHIDPSSARALTARRAGELAAHAGAHWAGSAIEEWPALHDRLCSSPDA
jgi:uncharacterized protein